MESAGYEKINPSAKTMWMIKGVIKSLFVLVIAYIIYRFTNFWALVVGGLLSCYWIFVYPFLEYRQWAYVISEKHIDYIHGIYYKHRSIIPISRVQHVDLVQGPLQKYFKLITLVIYTAGQQHGIVSLSVSKAQEIVENLNRQIDREAKDE